MSYKFIIIIITRMQIRLELNVGNVNSCKPPIKKLIGEKFFWLGMDETMIART